MWMKKQTGYSPEGRQDTRAPCWVTCRHQGCASKSTRPTAHLASSQQRSSQGRIRGTARALLRSPPHQPRGGRPQEPLVVPLFSKVSMATGSHRGQDQEDGGPWSREPQDDLYLFCTPVPASSATNAHCWRQMKPGSGGWQHQWKAITSGKSIERRVPSNSTLEQKTYPLSFIQSGLHFLSGFWTLLSASEMISPH